MIDAAEALRVDLVDLFSPRRTRREPSALRDNLDSADACPVAGSGRQCFEDFLAREFARIYLLRCKLPQNFFLCERRGRVDALVSGRAELLRQVVVDRAWVASLARGHLGCQQAEDESVLVCGPDSSIGAQK